MRLNPQCDDVANVERYELTFTSYTISGYDCLIKRLDKTMLVHHAGIDVSKQHLDIVLLQDDETHHHIFRNSHSGWQHLVAWLTTITQQVHICLEATGRYGDGIATYLYQQGYAVSVVNPARIHAYGLSRLKRQKTDKADALLITQFC